MRDTDNDWTNLGEFEPYFGVLSHERFLRHNLNEAGLAEFWQTGANHMVGVRQILIDHFGGEFAPKTAIDFGCGVGRLTRAMAPMADRVFGIDISGPMLEEARRNSPPENVEFRFDIPQDCLIDWIHSSIVFQHIPPARGYDLFGKLLDAASPKAMLSVHFMLFKDALGVADQYHPNVEFSTWDGRELKPLLRKDRAAGSMSMYDYDMNLLIAMMVRRGFSRYYMHHANHGGCHGVEIFARRD
ncbi:class I SAM-dependent methyltransferase [Sphingomonas paeninsulae]|nr:class I SAM-dependent methyltransferase [Sphingomonas paeninsulae]